MSFLGPSPFPVITVLLFSGCSTFQLVCWKLELPSMMFDQIMSKPVRAAELRPWRKEQLAITYTLYSLWYTLYHQTTPKITPLGGNENNQKSTIHQTSRHIPFSNDQKQDNANEAHWRSPMPSSLPSPTYSTVAVAFWVGFIVGCEVFEAEVTVDHGVFCYTLHITHLPSRTSSILFRFGGHRAFRGLGHRACSRSTSDTVAEQALVTPSNSQRGFLRRVTLDNPLRLVSRQGTHWKC